MLMQLLLLLLVELLSLLPELQLLPIRMLVLLLMLLQLSCFYFFATQASLLHFCRFHLQEEAGHLLLCARTCGRLAQEKLMGS
jgi:hypothetical protein